MNSILIVEDAPEIYKELAKLLDDEGFATKIATTQKDAINLLEDENNSFDLALLDLRLPDGYGLSIIGVANDHNVPSIILTALDDEYNLETAFKMGAFDYVSKPYRTRELISRIRSALRKSGKMQNEIRCRDLRVDTVKGVAYMGNQDLFLTRIEYRLLLVFMYNLDQVITRKRLFYEIWDISGEWITDNTLSVHIKRLREKIEKDIQNPEYIQTVRGLGYRMNK